jgi:metallophosphoesterase (TIGR03767 family)
MSARRIATAIAVVIAPGVALGTAASADTTLDRKFAPAPGTGYVPIQATRGERYVVRRGGSARARKGRAGDRRSLLMFAQLADPQIADEMSPARVDFADPAGGEIKSSWRPQEAMGLQVFDATVRSVNANRRSTVRQGNGRRARLSFAITTGDLADNQQLNETRWFRDVLNGGQVDPFSGKPIGPGNECAGTQAEVDALNADVAVRVYTGMQDYDDYPAAPDDRKAGFWDPDAAPPGAGAYSTFPRYEGLMERAQAPFTAAGLDVPWYISRGNHDGLIQGNAPGSAELFRAIAVGCLKVFPNAAFDPARFQGASDDELFAAFGDQAFITQLLQSARKVAPDPDRRIISKAEYRRLVRHGFSRTPRAQLNASDGTASYYAFNARRGIRFISLDTVAEGGGQSGNLDDPQYRWLKAELKSARRRDQLVVVFGHHTLGTMDNARNDEGAGTCDFEGEPGCDADPRRSTPIHRGTKGKRTVRALLAGTPNALGNDDRADPEPLRIVGHCHRPQLDACRAVSVVGQPPAADADEAVAHERPEMCGGRVVVTCEIDTRARRARSQHHLPDGSGLVGGDLAHRDRVAHHTPSRRHGGRGSCSAGSGARHPATAGDRPLPSP